VSGEQGEHASGDEGPRARSAQGIGAIASTFGGGQPGRRNSALVRRPPPAEGKGMRARANRRLQTTLGNLHVAIVREAAL